VAQVAGDDGTAEAALKVDIGGLLVVSGDVEVDDEVQDVERFSRV
jgi:hypothetical protein